MTHPVKNSLSFYPLLGIVLLLCSLMKTTPVAAALTDYQQRLDTVAANQGFANQDQRLTALMDIIYEYQVTEYPEYATWLGYPGQDDRWTDSSQTAIDRRKGETRSILGVLESISKASLSKTAQLDYQLIHKELTAAIVSQSYADDLMPINQMGGVQQDIASMIAMMPHRSEAQYENIVSRLESAGTLIEQNIAILRSGLEQGMTPPAITLRDVPQQILNQLYDDPMDSPLLAAFKQFPKALSEDQQRQLRQRAVAAYSTGIVPAYRQLLDFMRERYIPNAVQTVGLSNLPNGQAWYAHRAEQSTTTNLSPEQIHKLGLSEVKRIRSAMEDIIRASGFKGDFEAFTHFLRTDQQFYFTSKQDLLREYRDIAKRADAQLPPLFGKLPRLPYGVEPIPGYAEKSQTTAYYRPGAQSVGRAGIFFANTYALETRPKWEMEALTLHEAMPGHHLQIALAQEQDDLHSWRRDMYNVTAFVEGWGLYSESLGEEMGFYKDPYSKFGQLTYEMWRAVRLVVDTGMHSLGWSRQRAIDFFIANSAKSEHDITVEIDRYIVWPGQALAYKMGELKIKELRAFATAELGDAFDIRAFHDLVLEAGPIPLDILEQRVRDWVVFTAGA